MHFTNQKFNISVITVKQDDLHKEDRNSGYVFNMLKKNEVNHKEITQVELWPENHNVWT